MHAPTRSYVARLAWGDERALAPLIEQTHLEAWRLAAAFLGDQDAEEACDEAYLLVMDRADEIGQDISSQDWVCELVLEVALRRLGWTAEDVLSRSSLVSELKNLMPTRRLAELLSVSVGHLAEHPATMQTDLTAPPSGGSSPEELAFRLLEVNRPRPQRGNLGWFLLASAASLTVLGTVLACAALCAPGLLLYWGITVAFWVALGAWTSYGTARKAECSDNARFPFVLRHLKATLLSLRTPLFALLVFLVVVGWTWPELIFSRTLSSAGALAGLIVGLTGTLSIAVGSCFGARAGADGERRKCGVLLTWLGGLLVTWLAWTVGAHFLLDKLQFLTGERTVWGNVSGYLGAAATFFTGWSLACLAELVRLRARLRWRPEERWLRRVVILGAVSALTAHALLANWDGQLGLWLLIDNGQLREPDWDCLLFLLAGLACVTCLTAELSQWLFTPLVGVLERGRLRGGVLLLLGAVQATLITWLVSYIPRLTPSATSSPWQSSLFSAFGQSASWTALWVAASGAAWMASRRPALCCSSPSPRSFARRVSLLCLLAAVATRLMGVAIDFS